MDEPTDDDLRALRHEAGGVEVPRDVLAVRGPDALEFLQAMLTQQVAEVPVGGAVWSFLLQPQGKVHALVRVTRDGDASAVLDTAPGWGETVATVLRRFKLRMKVEIEPLDWRCVAVRGARAAEMAPGGTPVPWAGVGAVDLLGPDVTVPDGVRPCGLAAYESVRVEAGWPEMGSEIHESTTPHETGLVDVAVDLAKGCFPGQELVARVDSRGGNVPRHLRGVVVHGGEVPPAGATLWVPGDEKSAGALTSVGRSAERAAPVALAYVHRRVTPPAEVTVRWEGGEAAASVEPLPLVG